MSTYREELSEIITDARKLNIDAYLPYAYLYHKLLQKARMIVKRDSDNRRIFSQSHMFITIKRFILQGDTNDFLGIDNFIHRDNFMTSKEPLPEVFTTYTGLAIAVNTIEPSDKHFTEIRYGQYTSILKREYRDPREVYFWFANNHLVFPEVSYKAVRIDGLFIDPLTVKRLNGEDTGCEKMLDQLFTCPEYLQDDVRRAVVEDILKEFGAARQDELGDMNENNIVSQPNR